jgi:aspartate aminotransferase
MFQTLSRPPEDAILALGAIFRADTRQGKIDFGIGVYRDPQGRTPVMRAVKAAEERIWKTQDSKSYTQLAGDPAFTGGLSALVLSDAVPAGRVAAAAAPGGTGALRQGLELIRRANPAARIWLPDPTWPNHPAMLVPLGLEKATYRYYDAAAGDVDRAGMMADLAGMAAGDVLVVHGCCHNPTGADLTPADWTALAALCAARGVVPLIDLAYLGFGEGLEADAEGTRIMAAALPEVLVAVSCSKNFGIYRERTGLLIALTEAGERRDILQEVLNTLNRLAYSFAPDHGARVVSTILTEADLRTDWLDELEAIRKGMIAGRTLLAAELASLTGSDRFAYLARQRGMFSLLPASRDQVMTLRNDHGIYIIGNGRINVAALNASTAPALARAIIACGI